MVEIATGFAVLSLFLGWRLFVVSRRLFMANTMLRAMIAGKVVVTHTDDGVEMEIKHNG